MDNSTDVGTNHEIAEATELMMEIPARKAGAVIGRGGETIKRRLQVGRCVEAYNVDGKLMWDI